MPLAGLMDALTRLYGTAWVKSDTGYLLTSTTLSHFEHGVLQLGNRSWFQDAPSREGYEARHEQQQALADEIMDQVDRTRLNAPEGVPVTALSHDLIASLRHAAEVPVALNIVAVYAGAERVLNSVAAGTLHVASPVATADRNTDEFALSRATVLAADGRKLASFRMGTPLWAERQRPGQAKPKPQQPEG